MNLLRPLLALLLGATSPLLQAATSTVTIVVNNSVSPLATFDGYQASAGDLFIKASPGVTTITALGTVDICPECPVYAPNTPLAILTFNGYTLKSATIYSESLDKANRSRTRADAPYRIYYTATYELNNETVNNKGKSGAEQGDYEFTVIRAIPSSGGGLVQNKVPNTNTLLPGFVTITAEQGTNKLLSSVVSGKTVSYWYPLSPFASTTVSEQLALVSLPVTESPTAQVLALNSIDVLPMPEVTVAGIPSTIESIDALPNATVSLRNMYPGHSTFVRITTTAGESWTSESLNGVATGTISIPLAEILSGFRRSNNAASLQVFSEHAVANWRNAVQTGSNDAYGTEQLLSSPVTFTINITQERSINLSTL